jgi:hypothetical protein
MEDATVGSRSKHSTDTSARPARDKAALSELCGFESS